MCKNKCQRVSLKREKFFLNQRETKTVQSRSYLFLLSLGVAGWLVAVSGDPLLNCSILVYLSDEQKNTSLRLYVV